MNDSSGTSLVAAFRFCTFGVLHFLPAPLTYRKSQLAVLISIKNVLETASDHFAVARVQRYDSGPVTIGSKDDCDCVMESDDFRPVHFTLKELGEEWYLEPAEGAELYINNKAADKSVVVKNGDEIRIGHWLLKFQKVFESVKIGRSADLISRFTQILVIAILLCELFLVVWLPRKLKNAEIWALDYEKQRTAHLIDKLRSKNRILSNDNELTKAAREFIQDRLNTIASYIRKNEQQLTMEQWGRINQDLAFLKDSLAKIEENRLLQPQPPIDADAGVKALLLRHKETTTQ